MMLQQQQLVVICVEICVKRLSLYLLSQHKSYNTAMAHSILFTGLPAVVLRGHVVII